MSGAGALQGGGEFGGGGGAGRADGHGVLFGQLCVLAIGFREGLSGPLVQGAGFALVLSCGLVGPGAGGGWVFGGSADGAGQSRAELGGEFSGHAVEAAFSQVEPFLLCLERFCGAGRPFVRGRRQAYGQAVAQEGGLMPGGGVADGLLEVGDAVRRPVHGVDGAGVPALFCGPRGEPLLGVVEVRSCLLFLGDELFELYAELGVELFVGKQAFDSASFCVSALEMRAQSVQVFRLVFRG